MHCKRDPAGLSFIQYSVVYVSSVLVFSYLSREGVYYG